MKKLILVLHLFLCLMYAKESVDRRGEKNQSSDFWVRRTVLDEKPRMITISFGDKLYMAYDLGNSELYKIWSGGVIWEGAAINDIKTVQPRTWGVSYEQELGPDSYWMEESDNEKISLKALFKGYVIDDEKITFKYYSFKQGTFTFLCGKWWCHGTIGWLNVEEGILVAVIYIINLQQHSTTKPTFHHI